MNETAEERDRRLRQIVGGGESWESWYRVSNLIMDLDYASLYPEINPCGEITIASSQRCTLGYNPLVKFTKFKFNFNGKR
ncbi:MAG: hypothetical protein K0U52_12850 [Gammaproteobacteria bacterium]|nr:hypothetical protein [Gammaproteobacteria bacterium]